MKVGDVHGKLTLITEPYWVKEGSKKPARYVIVTCFCNPEKYYRLRAATWTKRKQCKKCPTSRTHGKTKTMVYRIWGGIKKRCRDPKCPIYHRYGGRGINVCDEWYNSFEAFYACVGDPPSDEHSMHRPNNDGSYGPDNWKWATAKEQANCRSDNVLYEGFGGEKKTIRQWVDDDRAIIKNTEQVRERLYIGWTIERAITEPINEKLVRKIKAFGEEKTLPEWVNDPRCKVDYNCLIDRLLNRGWSPEEAISTKSRSNSPELEAFGECKTLTEWEKDSRCKVNRSTLLYRLNVKKWDLEKSISTPSKWIKNEG